MCRSLKFISVLPQGRRSGLKLRKLIIYRCTLKMDFFRNFLFFVFFILRKIEKSNEVVGWIDPKKTKKQKSKTDVICVGGYND